MYPAGLANPLALSRAGAQLVAILNTTTTIFGIPALLLVTAPLVVRYRRAGGVERQQLKWFAVGGLLVGPTFAVAIFTSGFTSGPLTDISKAVCAGAILGLALLPVAIGLAGHGRTLAAAAHRATPPLRRSRSRAPVA